VNLRYRIRLVVIQVKRQCVLSIFPYGKKAKIHIRSNTQILLSSPCQLSHRSSQLRVSEPNDREENNSRNCEESNSLWQSDRICCITQSKTPKWEQAHHQNLKPHHSSPKIRRCDEQYQHRVRDAEHHAHQPETRNHEESNAKRFGKRKSNIPESL